MITASIKTKQKSPKPKESPPTQITNINRHQYWRLREGVPIYSTAQNSYKTNKFSVQNQPKPARRVCNSSSPRRQYAERSASVLYFTAILRNRHVSPPAVTERHKRLQRSYTRAAPPRMFEHRVLVETLWGWLPARSFVGYYVVMVEARSMARHKNQLDGLFAKPIPAEVVACCRTQKWKTHLRCTWKWIRENPNRNRLLQSETSIASIGYNVPPQGVLRFIAAKRSTSGQWGRNAHEIWTIKTESEREVAMRTNSYFVT